MFFIRLLLILFVLSSPAAASPVISFSASDVDIRTVIQTIARLGGLNLVADDSITGKITVEFEDLPVEKALDMVTKAKGLIYYKSGNDIIITSEKVNKGYTARVFHLRFAKAEEMEKLLTAILPVERVKHDAVTNAIIVYCTPAEAESVALSVQQVDVPIRQVSIESKVIALTKSASKELGFEWEWGNTPSYPEVKTSYETIKNASGAEYSIPKKTVTRQNMWGILQYGKNPEGIPYEFPYTAKIKAMLGSGDAKVLASPTVMAINGKEARIVIGDRIPVLIEKTENGQKVNTVDYVDAGIKLTYTPQISDDGFIKAIVHTEVSSPELVSELKAYKITTREAETTVRLKDGETLVIGGLISNEHSRTKRKVPLLGDFPILNSLFSSDAASDSESEVVVFLTSRIVNSESQSVKKKEEQHK